MADEPLAPKGIQNELRTDNQCAVCDRYRIVYTLPIWRYRWPTDYYHPQGLRRP